ncbi:NADH-quinone oxidoreductase subunit H [Paenibacillus sp. TRM 82003]|uniref:complex I subunit 1 family protein n=1 Tax=Kineococcus sp. TRM81007 TaxID=2925831 RepID=UPI001F5A2CFC|nr:complex I subunit 1 family protein [Kineococcus sp. TRM81007]MCI2237285.1 NADH-quinone oxidoreductase subunit H [Kineococcus sp. TRM81007]MCI3919344.1 NADH-quinone oxidoreductase subunit H [Paenibacillus sp. TRM 82003]
MPDVVEVSPLWAVPAALLVVLVAAWAACLDAGTGPGAVPGFTAPGREVARLLRQRRRTTLAADRLLWRLGGGGLLVAALLMVAVVPLGRWTLSDLGVGVVWFNAMDVLVWALVWMAGWGPNSAHALVGGYRFLAQALAYELPLMFALTAPAVAAGSLRVGDVVAAQQDLWFVVWMPVAFVVFCGCVVAFSVRGPFSSPTGADVAGGVLAEVSGVDRLLLLAGRYALLVAGSAFAVAAFLGGGAGPWLPGWLWSLLKTVALVSVLVAVRGRFPLLRPDRLVELGWVVVLPLTLLQLLVVSIVAVAG